MFIPYGLQLRKYSYTLRVSGFAMIWSRLQSDEMSIYKFSEILLRLQVGKQLCTIRFLATHNNEAASSMNRPVDEGMIAYIRFAR